MNTFYSSELCARCKGKGLCGKPCKILGKISNLLPKTKLQFSGSSPPEIFVGRVGYPEINTGILAPQEYGNNEIMSLPELWHSNNLSIDQVLAMRSQMIYSRFKSNIKDARKSGRFLGIMQEISMSNKSVSTEFILKKPAKPRIMFDTHTPLIGNPAPLQNVRLEENPHIEQKVDYIVSDTDNKASNSIIELYSGKIETSNIIKILSAGLLGLKSKRKLVPTRWAITATDDIISKFMLGRIRFYQEISEILVFTSEYVGNHYEFLLLPDKFSFEVIEAKIPGSVWNPFSQNNLFMQDYEQFNGRKTYASNVTGAYYSNRLALTEYLTSIKRQASCLVLREARPEYYAPLGVGILREASRAAFQSQPEKHETLESAFNSMQQRMKLPINLFRDKSELLKNYKKQTRLSTWL